MVEHPRENRGGALETVPPRGGIFRDAAPAEGLAEALEEMLRGGR
jgi:hypothetical protein